MQQQNPQKPQAQQRPVQYAQPKPMPPYGQPMPPYGQPMYGQRPIQKKPMPTQENRNGKKTKKKHYWWKYLLFTLLGMFVATGAIAGGIAIFAGKVPVKQVVTIVGQDPNKLITEKYQDDSIIVLITKFLDGTVDVQTLGGISEVTPLVDELYNQLNQKIEETLGVSLDREELFSKGYDSLADYLFSYFKSHATLAGFLSIDDPTTQNQLIKYICYKQNEDGTINFDSPRTIDEVMAGFSDGSLLDNAKVSDLFEIKGEDDPLYHFKDVTIKQFSTDFDSIVQDMKISEVLKIDLDDPNVPQFLKSLVTNEVKIGELSDYMNTKMRFADVISSGDSKLIQRLIELNPLINDIGETVESLTFGEIIDIDESSPRILQTISSWSLEKFEDDFGTLTISALFSPEQISSNKFLSAIGSDTLITEIGNAISNCKIVDVFADEIWGDAEHTIENMQGTWKYLLLNGLNDTSEAYKNYTVSGSMGTMINNMQYSIMSASINQLLADGMIDVEQSVKDSLLSKHSMASNTNEELLNPTGDLYGDLTVSEFILRLSWFVNLSSI